MGKAARRARRTTEGTTPKAVPAPFVRRPFEGLPGETDWVAMREIVPAATATVRVRPEATEATRATGGAAAPGTTDAPGARVITVATVLPMGRPGLRRADGERIVALQTAAASGDAGRDLAQVVLGLLAAEAGELVDPAEPARLDTPRLQDLLDLDAPFEPTLHDGFGFWVDTGRQLDAEATAALREADESMIPTTKLAAAPSAYWCRVGDRTHVRWILPDDEDAATDALARLHAAEGGLGGDDDRGLGAGTRFLGAFRACGLLAPVWDLDPEQEAGAYEEPLASFAQRYAAALADDAPLTPDARRAKAGILSRQLTLR